MEARNWEKRNSDIAFHEINQLVWRNGIEK